MRPLMQEQKRRLSNGVAVHPKQLLLLRWWQRRRERQHQGAELAEAGREELTPTPTHQQSQSTSRCQNSSSRMMKGQRDRSTCRGKRGVKSHGRRKHAVRPQCLRLLQLSLIGR